jgi:hypothetical protein
LLQDTVNGMEGFDLAAGGALPVALEMVAEAEIRANRAERQLRVVMQVLGGFLERTGHVCRLLEDGGVEVGPAT